VNFTSGDVFVVQNGHTMTTSDVWAISGSGSKLWIEGGGTLVATNLVAVPAFQVDNGGTYIHNTPGSSPGGSANDIPGSTARIFGASSTIEIQRWANGGTSPAALPAATWGNLTINVAALAGSWNQQGALAVTGNLAIQATGGTTREFRFVKDSPAAPTLTIGGNLSITGGIIDLTTGSAAPAVNIGGNFSQTGGTFKSSGSGITTVSFTGGSAPAAFEVSGGLLTSTNINWQIAAGKTLALNTSFGAGSWVAANCTMTIYGALQLNQGADPGNAGTWSYGTGATLIFNNASGSYSVNEVKWWPTTNGPTNVTVQGSGGLTVNAVRTVSGVFAAAGPVTNGGNLTINGTLRLDAGGSFVAPPNYGPASLLTYSSGGVYSRGAEWGAGTAQPGYPANVRISNNTVLNYPNSSTEAHSLSDSLTVDAGSELRMDYGSPGLSQPLAVGGDVTLEGALVLGDAAGGDLTVAGSWINNGSFDSRARKVTFNGIGGEQTIGGSQRSDFGDLAIAKGATVALSADNAPTVAGDLLNDGTLKQTRTVDNATVRFLHLTDNAGLSDKYLGVDITTSNNLGSTVVTVAGNQLCSQVADGGLPVRRCYTVTPAAPSAASLRFYFRQADLQNGQSVENLNVWRHDGATWQPVARAGNASTCSAGAINCWVSGSTAVYSPFALKVSSPLAVQLASFTATPAPRGTQLAWETVSEEDNAGFNLYRKADDLRGVAPTCQVCGWTRLNAALIPSAAPGASHGQAYTWLDDAAGFIQRPVYRLEAVGQDGTATVLGTTAAAHSPARVRLPWVTH
jgi:hypothetical protein